MKKIQTKQIISLILVIIWMIVVFIYSSQNGDESKNTSRKTAGKIIDGIEIKSELSQEHKEKLVDRLDPLIRKFAHYTIYLMGGILIINFFNTLKMKLNRMLLYSIAFGLIYASSDEIHQFFVFGRSAQITDVLIDTLGVATGAVIFITAQEISKKIKKQHGEYHSCQCN